MSLGLFLAGPLFATAPVPLGIGLCAALILAIGVVGIARFRRPPRGVAPPPRAARSVMARRCGFGAMAKRGMGYFLPVR